MNKLLRLVGMNMSGSGGRSYTSNLNTRYDPEMPPWPSLVSGSLLQASKQSMEFTITGNVRVMGIMALGSLAPSWTVDISIKDSLGASVWTVLNVTSDGPTYIQPDSPVMLINPGAYSIEWSNIRGESDPEYPPGEVRATFLEAGSTPVFTVNKQPGAPDFVLPGPVTQETPFGWLSNIHPTLVLSHQT